jgi:ABC-type glycerol-3-phosphate transport system substrate-binding protein
VLVAAATLAGCSGGPGSSAGSSGGAGGAGTTLTFAAVQGVEDTGIKALAPIYEKQTGVKINVVEFPYNDLYTKLLSTFQANDSTFDLFMSDDPWLPKWGTMGALAWPR